MGRMPPACLLTRRALSFGPCSLEVAQPGHAEAKLPQAGPKIPATTAAGAAAGAGAGASRLSAVSEEARRKLLVTSIASLSDAEGSVTLDNIMRACKDGSIIILPALEQTFDRKGGIPPHVLAEANAYVKGEGRWGRYAYLGHGPPQYDL